MKYRTWIAVLAALGMGAAVTACGPAAKETAAETTAAPSKGAEEADPAVYEISSGTWFYHGKEDEKSIDMDGMKGMTTYTAEAIPEMDGYLQFSKEGDDGYPVFDVYDLYGRFNTTMTFISEDQFYLSDDESDYYIKWDY